MPTKQTSEQLQYIFKFIMAYITLWGRNAEHIVDIFRPQMDI